ncbi:DEAD/DEAH box helicase [Oceanithermus desulfurans]|uniref:DEAD/DEAH box helicase n=2 Tax=Oceanithermus desulfurans TaxID=227924 RepID=A0A511RKY1_9DEIN|nr:DEAD/DEAH box helicase [Oceanithermus desulfurans]MBB6030748.1 hypothetical protein [Oceanithermus desulfurans]GEM90324.1 hypothetical protein ODE01S_17580 [Oceanithermus desulfurans NBRC 100063]
MRETLAKWVSDADALYHVERFGFSQPPELSHLRSRGDDYFISLVSELFDRLHEPYSDSTDWSRLGNAITQAGGVGDDQSPSYHGILAPEAAVFAAAAFYFGGYPASAYLTLKAADPSAFNGIQRACYELLSRPSTISSEYVSELVSAVQKGDLASIRAQVEHAARHEKLALESGPDEWVGWRLYRQIVSKFAETNIRAVLPDGESEYWNPLVQSLLDRSPPVWDFFASQINAIESGLLEEEKTFSVQMPTGSGKTALSEILLFHHLTQHPRNAAVLLVPYRSLAAELRGTIVRRLGRMGLPARSVYGGTVPTGDEVRDLDKTRAIVATPEALSGLLSAEKGFFDRISLVICDEGHLLDGGARGVSLELLLARMRVREIGSPKVVFVSAIVPNIEEINAWLGGTEETVVRSDYRPALADFAVLRDVGKGADAAVTLELHPHQRESKFSIKHFLSRNDFRYRNYQTGRINTYAFRSVKTKAIATARKALPMGAVAVFAANKRGNQGVVVLAEELLKQLEYSLPMAAPMQFVEDSAKLQAAVEYFTLEYGDSWIGTRTLAAGAVLHHGDIPQESREVLEGLVRNEDVRLTICTNTLAEGVNLPIRTLVLYSLKRRQPDGDAEDLLARDIKNLVGRAGRAGATTKGLVICANPRQWRLIAPVAQQQPGESVSGALLELMRRLRAELSQQSLPLTNDILEGMPAYHALTDGIDATLIDLAAEELGEEELVRIAEELSSQTFAAQQAEPEIADLMKQAFKLRAQRVAAIKNAGRLSWIRETGTRVRMLESVEVKLLPMRDRWDNVEAATDPDLVEALLTWAWELPEVAEAVKAAYRDAPPSRSDFTRVLAAWIEGQPFMELALRAGTDIDTMLGVHARLISYALQVAVEQGVGLLKKLLEASDRELSQAVVDFPDHLRFGVPTPAAKELAAGGVRHRRAAVAFGRSPELEGIVDRKEVFRVALRLIQDTERWRHMGILVFENTKFDLEQAINNFDTV